MKGIKNYDELIKYNNSILEYDKEVSEFNKSSLPIESKGYLIYNSDFYKLKELLNYNSYKMRDKHRKNKTKKFDFKEEDIKKIKKLEVIKIISEEFIKDKILYNDCVLITEKLQDLISNKYGNCIKFTAQKGKIILFIKHNKQLEFKHNNLILSLQRKDSKEDEIKNIYDSMLKYFIFENKIIEQLNENYPIYGSALLVGKNWLDKWKKYSNYEQIKENYLIQNWENISINIRKDLFNELIDYRETNKYLYLIPSENDILINNKNEITNILQKNQLALIDLSFKNFFPYLKSKAIEIKYQLSNGEIAIKLGNKPDLVLKANDNILSIGNIIQQKEQEAQEEQEENDLDNKDLRQLIKIFCFQRSFPDIENKQYANNKIQND